MWAGLSNAHTGGACHSVLNSDVFKLRHFALFECSAKQALPGRAARVKPSDEAAILQEISQFA